MTLSKARRDGFFFSKACISSSLWASYCFASLPGKLSRCSSLEAWTLQGLAVLQMHLSGLFFAFSVWVNSASKCLSWDLCLWDQHLAGQSQPQPHVQPPPHPPHSHAGRYPPRAGTARLMEWHPGPANIHSDNRGRTCPKALLVIHLRPCHPCDVQSRMAWAKCFCLLGLVCWRSPRRDNLVYSPDHSLAFPLTGSSSMWYVLILFRQNLKIKSVVLPETLKCGEETLDRQPPLQGMGNAKDLPDRQWHLQVLPNFGSWRGNNNLQYFKGSVWHLHSCPAHRGNQDPNIQESIEVDTSKPASGSTTPQFLCIIFATLCVNWELGAATHRSKSAKRLCTPVGVQRVYVHVFIPSCWIWWICTGNGFLPASLMALPGQIPYILC